MEMKMKVTGWALREAIKEQELRRDTAARAFAGTLKRFPDEQKDDPRKIVGQFLTAEAAVAKLQVAQTRYNLMVTLSFESETITLCEAVKRIGGLGRAEKMWRSATGSKPDRYSYGNEDVRDPNQVRAISTVTVNEAAGLASAQAKIAGRLRAAIATANAREVEIESLDATLFE